MNPLDDLEVLSLLFAWMQYLSVHVIIHQELIKRKLPNVTEEDWQEAIQEGRLRFPRISREDASLAGLKQYLHAAVAQLEIQVHP